MKGRRRNIPVGLFITRQKLKNSINLAGAEEEKVIYRYRRV
jgi:hypothetical protein